MYICSPFENKKFDFKRNLEWYQSHFFIEKFLKILKIELDNIRIKVNL